VVEVDLHDAQGQPVPVDLNGTPHFDARGRQVGLVFVGRPMAELKRAYQQLHQAHEALKRTQQQLLHSEKMASLGCLVAGVAHELNNPISFVLGNVHALRKYTASTPSGCAATSTRSTRPRRPASRPPCAPGCASTTCSTTCPR